jgi:hypothetical protein
LQTIRLPATASMRATLILNLLIDAPQHAGGRQSKSHASIRLPTHVDANFDEVGAV